MFGHITVFLCFSGRHIWWLQENSFGTRGRRVLKKLPFELFKKSIPELISVVKQFNVLCKFIFMDYEKLWHFCQPWHRSRKTLTLTRSYFLLSTKGIVNICDQALMSNMLEMSVWRNKPNNGGKHFSNVFVVKFQWQNKFTFYISNFLPYNIKKGLELALEYNVYTMYIHFTIQIKTPFLSCIISQLLNFLPKLLNHRWYQHGF